MARILLVEDNEMNRDMLTRALTMAGHVVVPAADGLAAIALAGSEQPDVVLMDLNIPGVDGWEATRRIKADARSAQVPVIALTAHAMADDRDLALEAGCDAYHSKPIDIPGLLGTIQAILDAAAPDSPAL